MIDYRLVPSDDESEVRWDDRVTWEGNVFGAFESLYPRLVADLPKPFSLQGSTRIDQSLMHVAIREALVNLLVHADYSETQASLIKRSSQGYLFRNPGSSRVSEADLLTGDRSDPRNPALVRMFRFIGLAEEAGTGIPKILQAWRELGFRLPAIHVGTERYEFVLERRYAHLLSEDDRVWLRSLGGDWSQAEQLALVLARYDGEVDNVKLRSLTGQHPADATKVLVSLRDRGLLQMIGGKRGARYQLGTPLDSALGPLFLGAEDARESTRASRGDAIDANLGTGDFATSPGDFAPRSGDLPPSPGDLAVNPGDLWQDLWRIASTAREHRYLSAPTLSRTILQLCQHAPLTLSELCQLLQRSEGHLRKVLATLVHSGCLTHLYPDRPSHPRQRYRAVQSVEH